MTAEELSEEMRAFREELSAMIRQISERCDRMNQHLDEVTERVCNRMDRTIDRLDSVGEGSASYRRPRGFYPATERLTRENVNAYGYIGRGRSHGKFP